MLLDTLLEAPQIAVYGFVNDLDRKVYLSYSTDVVASIRQKLTLYGMSDDYRNGKIRLVVYPCNSGYSKNALKLLVEQLQANYKKLGYNFYHRHRYIKYTVKLYVEKDMLIYVYLVSKNQSKMIVGIFSKMAKANAFVDLLKTNDPVIPVFALNALTKKHLLDLPFKRRTTSGQGMKLVKSKYKQIDDASDDLEY